MKKSNCYYRILLMLGAIVTVMFLACDKASALENMKCKIIIGDSRTTGIIATISQDKDITHLYDYFEGSIYDAIYLKGDTLLVLCSQGGGYYKNGAYDRAAKRALKLLQSEDVLKNCSSYSFYNLFAFNDIFLEPASCKEAPGRYIKKDSEIVSQIRGCQSAYQFNAGPVDERGTSTWKYLVTNPMIAEYNQGFKSNSGVTVVDLNGYLYSSGYTGIVTPEDDAGIHYNDETNRKIVDLLLALN